MNEAFDGLLVLDKPDGITSRDAVDRAQRWFPRGTRIGHTGTLDPLATGVLVLCLGSATRLTEYIQRMSKTYRAGIRLGARSDSDDAAGTVTVVPDAVPPEPQVITSTLASFIGTVQQVPPAFSAAKLAGQRAYDLARGGKEVVLRPRQVEISRLDVLSHAWPDLELEVHCGKGTYLRSLARDLGERLGCGGYICTLRRTRVGPFTAEAGLPLDTEAAAARAALMPAALAVSELPRADLTDADALRLCRGQAVPLPTGVGGEEVAVFAAATGKLLAVASVDARRSLLRPQKVMAS
jgi:tRNA pseudouridine55 synthase